MFLENIHQSTKTNLQTASSFNISSDLLLLLSEMCTCLHFLYTMYEYFNNYVITKLSVCFVMIWSSHKVNCSEIIFKLFQPCMCGKYRLSEFLMPKISTLVNIRFNSIQYFNGNSTVYWRDPINIKSRYITIFRDVYMSPFFIYNV
jgi:hypothetical protein